MSDTVIRVENLSKQYKIGVAQPDTLRDLLAGSLQRLFSRDGKRPPHDDRIWALKDVSLEIKPGEVVGIIGRNGAGKSTLLKILSRITEPTAGRAEIHGRVGSLLEVGTGFHGELTGRENIFLNGAILGMRKREIVHKFNDIIDFAEIGKFLDTPVKHYSSGMYVRLAFAVAAHLEPEILLVDEVLAVGDFAFQKKCLGKMQDVAGHGKTVVFVSHNTGAIKTLCNRCVLLENGRAAADGPTDRVVDYYLEQRSQPTGLYRSNRIQADHGKGFVLCHKENLGDLTIFCGDPITLEFDIEAPRALSEAAVGIGISITTAAGDRVISMNSLVQGSESTAGLSRLWRVRCDMGRLPLNAGSYFAGIVVGDAQHSAPAAKFEQAFTIHVMEYDVFGWGSSLPSPRWWGPMYWAPQWDIQPMSDEELLRGRDDESLSTLD